MQYRIRPRNKRGDWIVDFGVIAGKRRQFVAKSHALAKKKAAEKQALFEEAGVIGLELTAKQGAEAARCIARLGTATLTEATDYFLQHAVEPNICLTVSDLYGSHIRAQEARGLRPASLQASKTVAKPFVVAHSDRKACDISTKAVQDWLSAQHFNSNVTKSNVIRYISALFNYAKAQGMIQENPVDRIAKPKIRMKMPEFLSVEEVDRIFRRAIRLNSDCIPRLALGFFAGIRSGELDRLEWSDIKWADKIVTIRPEVAKTGTARHVSLSPNCMQWLKSNSLSTLFTPCPTARQMARWLKMSDWPHNAMRHTFATMHLALHQDASKTAFELGHRGDPTLLYRHYRGLATKGEAERYWNLRPIQESNVIRLRA